MWSRNRIKRRGHSRRQRPSRRRRATFKQRGGNPITFAIIAIFKNEAMGIREWIEHYIWQGVDKILLLDNNSTDNWKDTVKDIKDIDKYVSVKHAGKNYAQNEHYNTLGLPWLKENNIKVVAILDIDEYMFGTDDKNLKQHVVEIFSAPNRPSMFSCKWHMFGSSGHHAQPASIRKSFIIKDERPEIDEMNLIANNTEEGGMIKSIAWVDDIKSLAQHRSDVTGTQLSCPKGIQLNHYNIQSSEFFEKVKMRRGDVYGKNLDNKRSWKYFEENDHKDVKNTKLKDKVP